MPDESFSDAVSRRGVRASECVILPVHTLDARTEDQKAEQRALACGVQEGYKAVERAGAFARRVGLTENPYHPTKAAPWFNAWRRGWERG